MIYHKQNGATFGEATTPTRVNTSSNSNGEYVNKMRFRH